MNNISQIKSFTNNSLESKSFFSKNMINPKRDWSILIILFIFLIIASIGFDFYMYQKIVGGDMYVSVNKDELIVENLKSNDLKKIIDTFDVEKNNITKLKLENLVDPSI